MHEELVKRLHRQAVYLPEKISKNAELLDVLMKAADAIEKLQKAVNFHKFNSEFWEDKYNSLADEKWISVEERLPYKSGYYLVVTHLGLTDDAEDWMKDNAIDVTDDCVVIPAEEGET